MSKKHYGGPAPIPPGNRPTTGPTFRPEDEDAATEPDSPPGAAFQEQDPKRRLGGFERGG